MLIISSLALLQHCPTNDYPCAFYAINLQLSNYVLKPFWLSDHLRRYHSDETPKDLKYFQTPKGKLQRRDLMNRMFIHTSQRDHDSLLATLHISLLIAKSGKPHAITYNLYII